MIEPFADDETSSAIAGLTVENGRAAIAISGNLRITRDQAGLRLVQDLKRLADALLQALQAAELPDHVEEPGGRQGEVANPFL